MQFIYKVLRSFIYASQGMLTMISERNMKVHIVAAMIAIFLSLFLKITFIEWLIVMFLIGAVFALEMVNTAVEELANIVRDELKLGYKATQRARDVAAGAVFIMAIVAAIAGIAIFLPRLLALISIFSL